MESPFNIKEVTMYEGFDSKVLCYRELVRGWVRERELLGEVQPYTARNAAQKASLFETAFGDDDVRLIESHQVVDALIDLARNGGHKRKGLSSTTLRAAHLAGAQEFAWAIAKGLAERNPFEGVRRPREERRQVRFLLPAQASLLVAKATDQTRLGHSSAEVTMSIYAHAIPQSDSMAAALDSELFG